MNMSCKNACEQRVGILTFCQYYKATYVFQLLCFLNPQGACLGSIHYLWLGGGAGKN